MRHWFCLSFVVITACSKEKVLVSLDDTAGLAAGARVFAEGVFAGTVASIDVSDGKANLRLEWREGHTVSLRADACAVALPPELMVFPGKDLVPASRPVPACRDDGNLVARVKAVADSDNSLVADAAERWFLKHHHAPTLGDPCAALDVRKLKTEQADAVPVLLPNGGRRVWLSIQNTADVTLTVSHVRFIDGRGVEAQHAHLPEDDVLFSTLTLPPRSRREVSAVFEDARGVAVIEFETRSGAAPDVPCRSRWPL